MLQLDPASCYGGAWASYRLADLLAALAQQHITPSGSAHRIDPGYSNVELFSSRAADLGSFHEYNVDLAPKVHTCSFAAAMKMMFCATTAMLLVLQ